MTKAEKEAAKAAKLAEVEVAETDATDTPAEDTGVDTSVAPKKGKGVEYVVRDPQVLRPRELPLVLEPKGGKWANPEQERFAATLNGYAYKNPEKWEIKKETLLAQLDEIGRTPSAITKYEGNKGNLSYKNQIIEK